MNEEMVERTLTCHTPGCPNRDVVIVLPMYPDGVACCGPCGQIIEDVV